MTVTIRDVAKKAGFSITTVSRALNGYDDVSEKTRVKIIETAKELNYQPNKIAQNLVTKKLSTIGMFVLERETFSHPFVLQIISGFLDYATQKKFDTLLFGAQSLIEENSSLEQMCFPRGVGGAVIMGIRRNDPILTKLQEINFPTVLIDNPLKGEKATFVASDNRLGASQAVEHLIKLGHKNIGFINGHKEAWVSIERLAGYKKTLQKHDLPIKEEYIFHGDFSKDSGKKGAGELITNHPETTAFFASSDLMAAGAMEELHGLGYKVPEDISIIGFDDMEYASHLNPPLSTIKQDKYQMGVEAAKKIIAMVEEKLDEVDPVYLKTELILRKSTGPARKQTKNPNIKDFLL
ncbi:MAG: LacI family DNA-binding transcriptional regulator [Halanaerobiales bacterium]|nr:LacI family DNA-binding transcriptional regulator [Halanaerobiales bacterium]